MRPLLQVTNLKKYFSVQRGIIRRRVGAVKAVDGVSFSLQAGETVSLVGESGCGKTTTGRAVLRLIEPDDGVITLDGTHLRDISQEQLRQMRRRMQIIFQDPFSSLNPRQTVRDIIGAPMVFHGLADAQTVDDQVRTLLQQVGLQPAYASRYPHEFSGGQRQRIGIARAIALKPDLVVCDEAVSALDVSVQAQIINLLSDLKHALGLSYLFIAHDLSVVRYLSDHVAVMYLGRIVEHASRDDLFAHPAHPYSQALLSAVPHADPRHKKKRIVLAGDVPSPMHPPTGCHFHTRCPLAWARCAQEAPPLHEIAPRHVVRCHLYETRRDPVDITQPALSARTHVA